MDKYPRFEEVKKHLADFLPNNDNAPNYDSVLEFTLEKVISDVSIYTNIPILELPEELEPTILGLAVQTIDTHQWLVPKDQQVENIQSLSEGDTSVSFRSPSDIYSALQAIDTITDNYVLLLNNFRRLAQ
ncbi:hypothetical protein LJCM5343_17870 [Lactobacillus paragasseri]|jgi:hypothetical protein|uniref:hypothetical protein n=1 Tax=Lactobacillus TaxID=1578 RepID=UPI000DBB6666|nr:MULTISPECIES: hypothetical protein [Lactobacillus]MBD0889038.1 hypothetical protein [Lactobacillus gasseri]MDG9742628.1 hypothetical protein [Lactobacillus paragasseri]BBD48299.1 hypothetical protein LpgJCM5343_06520 [Lactobacillus paragasseri]GBA88216.1 hypothetical protein LJCM5343_17870 [Lactobacillus paragasseri]